MINITTHFGWALLASLFILAGINQFANPSHAIAMMTGAGLPMPALPVYGIATL